MVVDTITPSAVAELNEDVAEPSATVLTDMDAAITILQTEAEFVLKEDFLLFGYPFVRSLFSAIRGNTGCRAIFTSFRDVDGLSVTAISTSCLT